ncbi:uncharacterized protein LOC133844671 isoform X1 [Drosophila sulfurigaster albostrigata]|uniref:Uncharacterized protein LOC117572335 isoform X1 n=1 Tax=Drosophila albomicans TaxID=7291 RepID=A0A6P8XHL7_DROAB|nr:uncharacterized protein LOC117572335 isoform X1 [Drosophila albomicans]XP_060660489.1 uncharacterized protein LOC132794213 isoform X1 [Drosophila nasuta]XP_062134740.1 uncharacterized protein LOC133844671 isoform X1 [Drosophila sulfurigaster albostrigata]
MHARFADPEPASPDSVDKIETETLESRIEDFKQNPNNMTVLHEFIDEVVQHAETEANKRALEAQKSQQGKEKRQSFAIPDFKNGKVVNRARGFVVRIFDAICNCANNNAAAATTRFKLRSNGTGGGGGAGGGKRQQSQDEQETLALSKKKPSAEGKKKAKGVTMADNVEAGVRLMD